MENNSSDIFARKQKELTIEKKRWNYYAMFEIKNGKIICENNHYSIDDLCKTKQCSTGGACQPICILNGTTFWSKMRQVSFQTDI